MCGAMLWGDAVLSPQDGNGNQVPPRVSQEVRGALWGAVGRSRTPQWGDVGRGRTPQWGRASFPPLSPQEVNQRLNNLYSLLLELQVCGRRGGRCGAMGVVLWGKAMGRRGVTLWGAGGGAVGLCGVTLWGTGG